MSTPEEVVPLQLVSEDRVECFELWDATRGVVVEVTRNLETGEQSFKHTTRTRLAE